MMMNKKGIISIGMVMAGFIGIVLLIFLSGGGAVKIFEISSFLKTIPSPVWIIFGIIILFKMMGGKGGRRR